MASGGGRRDSGQDSAFQTNFPAVNSTSSLSALSISSLPKSRALPSVDPHKSSMSSSNRTEPVDATRVSVGSKKKTVETAAAAATNESPFHGFFDEGNIGLGLFDGYIRSYFDLKDVSRCASAGNRQLHGLCRTYTARELQTKFLDLPLEAEKCYLCEVLTHKVTKYSAPEDRPHRGYGVMSEDETFFAKLYHRDEIYEVNAFFKAYLSSWELLQIVVTPSSTNTFSDSTRSMLGACDVDFWDVDIEELSSRLPAAPKGATPLLIAAKFRPADLNHRRLERPLVPPLDVTHILKRFVKASGTNNLYLFPPPRQDRSNLPIPKLGLSFWYTRLFGDPWPQVGKFLELTLRYPGLPNEFSLLISENETVSLQLEVCD